MASSSSTTNGQYANYVRTTRMKRNHHRVMVVSNPDPVSDDERPDPCDLLLDTHRERQLQLWSQAPDLPRWLRKIEVDRHPRPRRSQPTETTLPSLSHNNRSPIPAKLFPSSVITTSQLQGSLTPAHRPGWHRPFPRSNITEVHPDSTSTRNGVTYTPPPNGYAGTQDSLVSGYYSAGYKAKDWVAF